VIGKNNRHFMTIYCYHHCQWLESRFYIPLNAK